MPGQYYHWRGCENRNTSWPDLPSEMGNLLKTIPSPSKVDLLAYGIFSVCLIFPTYYLFIIIYSIFYFIFSFLVDSTLGNKAVPGIRFLP